MNVDLDTGRARQKYRNRYGFRQTQRRNTKVNVFEMDTTDFANGLAKRMKI